MANYELDDGQRDLLVDALFEAWEGWQHCDADTDIAIMELAHTLGSVSAEELDEFIASRLAEDENG